MLVQSSQLKNLLLTVAFAGRDSSLENPTREISGSFLNINWEPVLPPILILLLVLGLLGLAFCTTVRRDRNNPESISREKTLGLRGRLGLLLLRSVALLVLSLILLNPVRPTMETSGRRPTNSRPPLYILVDDSRSMGTRDIVLRKSESANPLTRFEAIQKYWLANDFLTTLTEQVEPIFYRVGRELRSTTVSELRGMVPESDGSRLAEQLRAILRLPGIENSAGILLLSDGRDTSGERLGAVGMARLESGRVNVPISVVPLGSTEVPADVAVQLIAEDTDVYQGQRTTLHAELRQHGYTNRIVDVVLQQNGTELERRRLRLENASHQLRFEVTPTGEEAAPQIGKGSPGAVGLAEYTIAVEPFPAEQIRRNNTRHAFIRIHDARIRVALFENEPYWDTRFLVKVLRADPQVELTTITGINDRIESVARYEAAATGFDDNDGGGGGGEGGKGVIDEPLDPLGLGSGSAQEIVVPTSLLELADYDIVMLGQGVERWFPGKRAEALVDFVIEHGGSLVFVRGIPCRTDTEAGRQALEILEVVSPITWGQERLTAAGTLVSTEGGRKRGPIDFRALGETDRILTRLPQMLAQTAVEREKAFSVIWLRAQQDEPLENSADSDSRNRRLEDAPAAVAHLRAGRGQSLALLTHGLWQWALLPPAEHELAGAFQFFWYRCIRWLVGAGEMLPGQSISLRLDRLSVEPGEAVELLVQTRFVDPAALSMISAYAILPSGRQQMISLSAVIGNTGRLAGRLTVTEEGIYRIVLKTPSLEPEEIVRRFAVQSSDRELIDPSLDRKALELLAQQSLGTISRFDNPTLTFTRPGISQLSADSQEKLVHVWDTLATYLVLVLTLSAEWLVRRHYGMA